MLEYVMILLVHSIIHCVYNCPIYIYLEKQHYTHTPAVLNTHEIKILYVKGRTDKLRYAPI